MVRLDQFRGDEEAPPRLLVALAELTQALTQKSPLIALTVLGILLIVAGAALRLLDTSS
jgi:hypothetical protein